MERRRFIGVIASGLLAAPLAAGAQPVGKIWRIGAFHVGLDHVPPSLDGLRDGLRALGYEEGKNIHLDWRNLADETAARATAKVFVQDRVDVMVAFENQSVRAAMAATSEIPIVFLYPTDPVADRIIKSYAHPGGNLTGLASIGGNFPAKRLQLLKELVPRARRLLVLVSPADLTTPTLLPEVRRASTVLKFEVVERTAANQAGIDRVFSKLAPSDAEAVYVVSASLWSVRLVHLTYEKRLPLASHRRESAEQGALFSWGANFRSVGQAAARYIDRILKGAKPADLPVEEVSQFLELVINLKTAKALGLTIPPSLLLRADEVIE